MSTQDYNHTYSEHETTSDGSKVCHVEMRAEYARKRDATLSMDGGDVMKGWKSTEWKLTPFAEGPDVLLQCRERKAGNTRTVFANRRRKEPLQFVRDDQEWYGTSGIESDYDALSLVDWQVDNPYREGATVIVRLRGTLVGQSRSSTLAGNASAV